MQMRQELVVQAEPDVDETSALVLHDGHRADLARLTDLIQQTRDLVRHVSDAREGVMLVRRASATDKLVAEALRGCRLLESEQYALRQAAAEAHLRTQRRAGEMLARMEKNGGGRPPKTHLAKGRVSRSTTLAELGITRNESHRWQQLAALADDQFEDYISECYKRKRELTTLGALARARSVATERSGMLERPSSREAQLARYERIKRALSDMIWLDAAAVIAAMDPARRPAELESVMRPLAWLEQFRQLLDHCDVRLL